MEKDGRAAVADNGTIYKIADVEADPVQKNSNLGYYTNFVNLFDLAALAIPAGFRKNGLPFGVTLIGPAFSDRALLSVAGLGTVQPPGCISVAVVGAHLSGQPLNSQLTERGARLMKRLPDREQLSAVRPGQHHAAQARSGEGGWLRRPWHRGRGVVDANPRVRQLRGLIPGPLGIGSLQLEDGSTVKGFICEPAGLVGATEITTFGGWRKYLQSK